MIIYTYFIDLTNYFVKVLSERLSDAILKLWEQTFRAKKSLSPLHGKNLFFERKDFMKFKVVGKSLILTDHSHKITEGENSFDTVEIAVPHYHDDCDLSMLSFRFSGVSEDGETSAVQVLHHEKCDEKYIYLKGAVTSEFSAITGKVTFMLTGVSGENVVAKFQSDPFTVSDDISLASLPNETTAEQLFNQTQLEVQKAIDAANRAEIASQTPAPAEIYPATTTRLGGVKIDGTTITASSDGTISAVDSEKLKNEIVDIKSIIMPASQPNNFLIYDNAGKPSVMVAIPKFYLDEVIDGASHTVHPAFIINDVEQDVIYISKYQNIVENERAYSLPMKDPKTNINFDTAYSYCKAKGKGWHLMTNAEWAAIALWCKKNGTMPKGNNNYGKDISENNLPQKAIAATRNSDGTINHILTGSGPESWYHNGTFSGIADLNGNVWEWISGVRLNDGEIQIIENNDAADCGDSVSEYNTHWKAVKTDGSLVDPGTAETLKYDFKSNKCVLSTGITNRVSNGTSTRFSELTADSGINVPERIKALTLFPAYSDGHEEDLFLVSNANIKITLAGGTSALQNGAGLFNKHLGNSLGGTGNIVGFRCAYYKAN